jgi:hypothetical protein
LDRPSTATVKRLFAVSGNRCAFPSCSHPLVEPESGKVVGRICHIKASSPRGPRYDPTQTDEERHSFANLLLMCPVHHDVIDADEKAYTVSRLEETKRDHEAAQPKQAELSEAAANQFIANITGNTVQNGSIIYSVGQTGGQVAHSITNIGPQPRTLNTTGANELAKKLSALPPHNFEVEAVHGDAEANRLAHQLVNLLSAAGWQCVGFASSMFPRHMTGLTASFPEQTAAVNLVLQFLGSAQLAPHTALLPTLDKVHLLVGSRL